MSEQCSGLVRHFPIVDQIHYFCGIDQISKYINKRYSSTPVIIAVCLYLLLLNNYFGISKGSVNIALSLNRFFQVWALWNEHVKYG